MEIAPAPTILRKSSVNGRHSVIIGSLTSDRQWQLRIPELYVSHIYTTDSCGMMGFLRLSGTVLVTDRFGGLGRAVVSINHF